MVKNGYGPVASDDGFQGERGRKKPRSLMAAGFFGGARGGSRTRTPLRALAPEASESTNSTTRASRWLAAQRKMYTTMIDEKCQPLFFS